MSVIETPTSLFPLSALSLLTVEEYDLMGRAGAFGPDPRLELIEGRVVEKMSPQESRHSTGIRACEEALRSAFPQGYDVRVQMPLVLGPCSKPEPDIAAVRGSFRDYTFQQPTTAVLVVEVSDSTTAFDRMTKAALYARAGIQEYWILVLSNAILEVYRQPDSRENTLTGFGYARAAQYGPHDSISPLEAPDRVIFVRDLLP